MQRRRRSHPPRIPRKTFTCAFWRRPSLSSLQPEQTYTDYTLAQDDGIVERQGLQAQVTIAAVFVAISGGIFYVALRHIFAFMP